MHILNSCCGCCSLKLGTIISACRSLIGGFFMIFTAMIMAVMGTTVPEAKNISYISTNITFGILGGLVIIVSIFVIVGALTDQEWLLAPWIILEAISILAAVAFILYISAIYIQKKKFVAGVIGILLVIIIITILTYLWLVVVSFFLHLREEKYSDRSDTS